MDFSTPEFIAAMTWLWTILKSWFLLLIVILSYITALGVIITTSGLSVVVLIAFFRFEWWHPIINSLKRLVKRKKTKE